jgi:TRAP-type C4-dicarboxylate transport system permease small subunit
MYCKIVGALDKVLQKLLITLMALLLLDVTWQVLTRFLLENPSSFTEELARFLLIWIGLLGSAHAYRHKMHLGVDIVVKSLSPKVAGALAKIVQLITIAFAASVLVYGGTKLLLLAVHLEQKSPAMQVNMGLVYLALPISGVLLVLYAIEHMLTSEPLDIPEVLMSEEENV